MEQQDIQKYLVGNEAFQKGPFSRDFKGSRELEEFGKQEGSDHCLEALESSTLRWAKSRDPNRESLAI